MEDGQLPKLEEQTEDLTRKSSDPPTAEQTAHSTQHLLPVKPLGTLLLHNSSPSTQDLVKNIPKPTTHPSDPLNWSAPFKWYVLTVSSLAGLLVNFVAIGPSIGLPEIADYLTGIPFDLNKTLYLFSTTFLFRSFSMIVWMPMVNKLGRRPVGLLSLGISTLAALACAVATRRFTSQMAARFFLGFGAGGVELVAPLIVTDLFFVHQRGLAMALYSAFFYFGISLGSIVFGTMIQTRDWPDSYCLSAALLGAVWLLTAITIPETAFRRPISNFHKKLPPGRCMRLWSGVIYTQETLTTMLGRLFSLVCFPAICWSIILWGFQLAFLVAIVTNLPKSYALEPYAYTTIGSGFMSFAGLLGAMAGFVQGGPIVDWISTVLTRRNNGVFEPEFRLPALLPCLVSTPLGLLLYGLGLHYRLSWVSAPAALFFLNYSLTTATSIGLMYSIDILNPIASEVISTTIMFRGIVTFAMTCDVHNWIDRVGPRTLFVVFLLISLVSTSPVIPFYFHGRFLRQYTASIWPPVSTSFSWNKDRI
ncbi:hypothetical protein PTTG_07872 [Puccinia triticina 1-1 BBBD Race 1]|uniref:MFS domain-containing protein n=2 Tax=Puccinia triticina TaxID=208348 RepID=A0A180GH86_PUCT1|nr:uncharacterized protein PtA15_18A323 [Puccinia triticina]OAV92106.1 hypothetical protein PTTG_07872 [Puccinia triticina 1-1 BBBD Race 1]WAQ93265.1 hypothetical protein PtA15_18A323 [Puccinia triticina]WAR63249.1 hypothetical protein PtB15_18B331 [Puccinia triticina]